MEFFFNRIMEIPGLGRFHPVSVFSLDTATVSSTITSIAFDRRLLRNTGRIYFKEPFFVHGCVLDFPKCQRIVSSRGTNTVVCR